MNLRLQLAQIYIPGFIKKKGLKELFNITADAFQCAVPETRGFSCKELLKRYALLTRDEAERSIQQGKELQSIKRDLYENAYRLGKRIRKSLRIRNAEKVKTISRLLYHIMGIDFQWSSEGEIIIKECYFSQFYSNRVWHKTTKRLFEICKEMNLAPLPTPKMVNYDLCLNCGRCTLACPQGAKWDSRQFLQIALDNGAHLITSCRVEKVLIKDGRAAGVQARMGWQRKFLPADLIILAAGGLATPVILQNSGIACNSNLFVDPVLCVAAEWKESLQNKEISMPFIVQREHFILSPYFDHLSFFFNRDWKFPARNTLGIMIKLADSNTGTISDKKIEKALTVQDKKRLGQGVEICTEILARLGVEKDRIFLGSINAGHPGGMLRLTEQEAETFHNSRLPENLYVADATLFPESTGNPPILTIIAMAKRVSKLCC